MSWPVGHKPVKTLICLVGWCSLLVLCWPIAVLALIGSILFFPARMLGYRRHSWLRRLAMAAK